MYTTDDGESGLRQARTEQEPEVTLACLALHASLGMPADALWARVMSDGPVRCEDGQTVLRIDLPLYYIRVAVSAEMMAPWEGCVIEAFGIAYRDADGPPMARPRPRLEIRVSPTATLGVQLWYVHVSVPGRPFSVEGTWSEQDAVSRINAKTDSCTNDDLKRAIRLLRLLEGFGTARGRPFGSGLMSDDEFLKKRERAIARLLRDHGKAPQRLIASEIGMERSTYRAYERRLRGSGRL
jgi:hypothetical protein